MIYDFNPIYGHLQECWTGCKSVKDHKILMRTAEIHLGELPSLPRAASWGQEDEALPSSQLAETGVGGWGGDKSAWLEERVEAKEACFLRACRAKVSCCLRRTTGVTAALKDFLRGASPESKVCVRSMVSGGVWFSSSSSVFYWVTVVCGEHRDNILGSFCSYQLLQWHICVAYCFGCDELKSQDLIVLFKVFTCLSCSSTRSMLSV